MDVSQFLGRCLLLDLEAANERIYRIGAVYAEKTFERRGRLEPNQALRELDAFAKSAEYLLGHNLLDYDIPLLACCYPRLQLLEKPVVDTLFLSALAFPENPYHHLVKDYKLVRDALNDPVADARLAASVFKDQWESLARLLHSGHQDLLAFYRFCLEHECEQNSGSALASSRGLQTRGLVAVFDALQVPAIGQTRAKEILHSYVGGRVCTTALMGYLSGDLCDAPPLPALAYAAAWLRVAGSNSVLPPWVRHRFPAVAEMLRALRDRPCEDSACDYCGSVHSPRVQLQRYFRFSEFRPFPVVPGTDSSLQEAVVRLGMADQPLLAILPTGGGKSLCYQLPALVRHFRRGLLTIVISPLQALMKDQVDNLVAKTAYPCAAALYGLLTPPERGEVLERVRLGDVALLYVAPEQLRNKGFRKVIAQREIGCWVFDEAHCLSKWGHDFRPDYLYAGRFIREFAREQKTPAPPIACFTATAKRDVEREIVDFFRRELDQTLQVFKAGVERDNLRFEVQLVNRAEKLGLIHAALGERLSPVHGSAIVYAATRSSAEQTAQYLQQQGWAAAAFHGGLIAPTKRMVQEAFIAGDIRIICATNAFGMGIDKSDVRLVLHMDIPGSLENYLQEAGRAGRDLEEAECVLLYGEDDVETQFKLEAISELSRRDIAQLWRGLRRARRNRLNEVIITTAELLRDEDVETSFDTEDRQADTKVKAAVAWLERGGFLERNENDTRVFQGKPLVTSMAQAQAKMAPLNLSAAQSRRWLAILEALINAEADAGLSADELAELPALRQSQEEVRRRGRAEESETQRVLRTLHDMAEAGLIQKGLLLNAFVRHKVTSHSLQIFNRVCALDKDMLSLMREVAPDAADDGWLDLSLRSLNQRLVDEGHPDSSPQVVLNLLKSLSRDGRGLAGSRGSLELRYVGRDHYRVKLQRDWESLVATAGKRRAVAKVALETILSEIPPEAPASAELLVQFSSEGISKALRSHLYLAGQIKDMLAAIDRGLMFLHEHKVIILQQGLAVFRQAMTIRILPQPRARSYTKGDYEPLHSHYRERVFQVHVMNEYARLGIRKIREALEFVLAYFSMDKASFIRRYFPGRKELLECATSQESYRRIVEDLGNRVQTELVSAPEDVNMLVLAGPGSGKTLTVVHRCAYLLRVRRVPARSILVLCFNRNAAVSLRRRLSEMVGADARGLTVQTYHGLALRLCGMSFAERAEKGRSEPLNLDELIPRAIRLLRGETEVVGLEADELRERLLSGYAHILVDEYQDIDRDQYELISALAGRTERDQDRRLTILAVGDDDQNIYTFRGANVEFIRRFHKDYQAQAHYLVENYRSSAHIIAAANQLIGLNVDRMKTEWAIRINKARERDPQGGLWNDLDPVTRGRVQILHVPDASAQAAALVSELQRLRRIMPALQWSECAVLGRTRDTLFPIRALLESATIPVMWGLSRDKTPPLHRIREIAWFLDELKARRKELWTGSRLQDLLQDHESEPGDNPWRRLLEDLVVSWRDETADAEIAVASCIEYIYEALAEQRREQRIGRGIFLSTVHAAKGMEFEHVFIPDGGWSSGRNAKEVEEERRVLYVGMTRAKQTLCLFKRKDASNPHVGLLQGDFLLCRPGAAREPVPEEIMHRRYALLGPEDMFLSFAAGYPSHHRVHRQLAALRPGDCLIPVPRGGRIELRDEQDHCVAMLSQAAARNWAPCLPRIESVRVVAMVRRQVDDSDTAYQARCRCEQWEVPAVEVVYRQ